MPFSATQFATDIFFPFLALLSAIIFLWGVVSTITATENERSEGKRIMKYGVIGVLVFTILWAFFFFSSSLEFAPREPDLLNTLRIETAYAQTQIPEKPTLADIITKTWNDVIRPAIIFLFVLATVIFIWGLIEFVMSADSEEGRTRGKRNIVWGIVGMAIMLATGAIMVVIDNFFQAL